MNNSIHESDYEGNNFHIARSDEVLSVTLTYPNIADSKVRIIEIDQESVRASDSIRLKYDYDRDGWVVMQASKWNFSADDEKMDMDWKETAFIQSWARDPENEE